MVKSHINSKQITLTPESYFVINLLVSYPAGHVLRTEGLSVRST